MKNNRILYLGLVSVFIFLGSCSDDGPSEEMVLEDRLFENYLAANNITTEPTESGLYYIEEIEGSGAQAEAGNWAVFNYSLYTIKTGSLVVTTNEVLARNVGIYDERILYGPNKVGIGNNILGLDEGLQLMKEGGKAKFLFKSDLGYGKSVIGNIESYSSLLVQVELIEVIEDPVQGEYESTIAYLEENNYSTDTIDSGIYYITTFEGYGDSVSYGDLVTIDLKASLLDGRVLSDVKSHQYIIGSSEVSSTLGLSAGIKDMIKGEACKLIVPYNYAFGPSGKTYYDGFYKIIIPPYSTIVYEVRLDDI